MAAGSYDFLVEQGATFSKTITWKNSSNAAINLTGYTARMQFRATKASTTVLLSATTENGYITLGSSAGTIDISIPSSVTATLAAPRQVYDLELQSSAGVVTRLLEGAVRLSLEVTR